MDIVLTSRQQRRENAKKQIIDDYWEIMKYNSDVSFECVCRTLAKKYGYKSTQTIREFLYDEKITLEMHNNYGK